MVEDSGSPRPSCTGVWKPVCVLSVGLPKDPRNDCMRTNVGRIVAPSPFGCPRMVATNRTSRNSRLRHGVVSSWGWLGLYGVNIGNVAKSLAVARSCAEPLPSLSVPDTPRGSAARRFFCLGTWRWKRTLPSTHLTAILLVERTAGLCHIASIQPRNPQRNHI